MRLIINGVWIIMMTEDYSGLEAFHTIEKKIIRQTTTTPKK